jgi:hypothetical protein
MGRDGSDPAPRRYRRFRFAEGRLVLAARAVPRGVAGGRFAAAADCLPAGRAGFASDHA